MTAPTIEFNAKAVAPLSLFVAKTDIRFYLHGLFVTPSPNGNGCVIAGCNGHHLALWHDPEGNCSEERIFKISPAFVAACKRRIKGNNLPRKVAYVDGRLLLTAGDEEIFIQAGKAELEGKYPEIFKVVPPNDKLVPGLHGHINAEYIKTIGEAGRLAAADASLSVGVSHYSSKAGRHSFGPIVTRFDRSPQFLVVTMPMRGKDDFPVRSPVPACFTEPDTRASVKATVSYAMGSMGEEVAA